MYTHNDRSALTAATLGTDACRYTYDNDADGGKASWTNAQHLPEGREAERRLRVNIGNRKTSQEGTDAPLITYAANDLNQYTAIAEGAEIPFTPTYDADGNQTNVKTSTGEWNVTYNGLNQAIRFEQGSKRVECVYDYMNRRVEKAVYEGDILLSRKRFIYKDYLQIAELDAMNITDTVLGRLVKTYLWDPAEPVATRVLVMRNYAADGSHEDLYYTHDLLKNTTALFGIKAGRRALYEYAPYGATIKSEGDMAEGNPFRFSSEYYDDELEIIKYIYRCYNPLDGRWTSRDYIDNEKNNNVVEFVRNSPSTGWDFLGLIYQDYRLSLQPTNGNLGTVIARQHNNKIEVQEELWEEPNWWNIATQPRKIGTVRWREATDEELYLYFEIDDKQLRVCKDSGRLLSKSCGYVYNKLKIREQVIAGNLILAVTPTGMPGYLTQATSAIPKMVYVSRWGRSGLEAGDWVMKGPKGVINYLRSGKYDIFTNNKFAKYSTGKTYTVPQNTLKYPKGWEAPKGILGQRIYKP